MGRVNASVVSIAKGMSLEQVDDNTHVTTSVFLGEILACKVLGPSWAYLVLRSIPRIGKAKSSIKLDYRTYAKVHIEPLRLC